MAEKLIKKDLEQASKDHWPTLDPSSASITKNLEPATGAQAKAVQREENNLGTRRVHTTLEGVENDPPGFELYAESLELENFLEALPPLDGNLKLGLTGSLGAGKTTLVKAFLQKVSRFGDQVQSPSYAYYYAYQDPENPSAIVYHFDFYRLEQEQQLFLIGFFDLFEEPRPILIEWVELFPSVLALCNWWVRIVLDKDQQRKFLLYKKLA